MAHCLALPLLVSLLPALGSVFALPERFHLYVLAVAVPAATFALARGRAKHGATWPLLFGAAGIGMLAAGALLVSEGAMETIVTTVGNLMLAAAHLANWRLRHDCRGISPA